MSDTYDVLAVLALLLVFLPTAFWLVVRWWRRGESDCDRIIREARQRGRLLRGVQHDVGPDALRLLEELDAHLDEHVLANPELAAGFDRLRDAIRDHRKEEEA